MQSQKVLEIMKNLLLGYLLISLPKTICLEVVKKVSDAVADCIASIKYGDID